MKSRKSPPNPADEAFNEGHRIIMAHPIFRPMLASYGLHVLRRDPDLPRLGLTVISNSGYIQCNKTRRATPDEWVYALAHSLLHLGFGHIVEKEHPREWNVACDCFVARFLADIKLGTPPASISDRMDLLPRKSEEELYQRLCRDGIPSELLGLGMGDGPIDMLYTHQSDPSPGSYRYGSSHTWPELFAAGLAQAVSGAVRHASGQATEDGTTPGKMTPGEEAKAWFISSYPLLGALAAMFRVIEDIAICDRMNVGVAAVWYEPREIFINPAAGLSREEYRFVMAHELLHVGLRHDARVLNRDPYLWNVACDFVINGWLVEMGVGHMPGVGGLYDPALKGLSAETIYDRLATDIRRSRKLMTLRNRSGHGDMLGLEQTFPGGIMSLEDAVRRALYQGLDYHEQENRGLLPASLVEEIRALSHPPIPWDVELAEWFQGHFAPLEKRRSYARMSRRQSSTPDIPRPSWYTPAEALAQRTFGVIIDTSGSMDRLLLAKALGAVASYSVTHEVPAARVVFCDARVYDEGYLQPDDIAGRVKVRGRGGTVLQPAIDYLQAAEDFPKDGPVLVITDGFCDRLSLRREHAFLIPKGAQLPFPPRGRIFRME